MLNYKYKNMRKIVSILFLAALFSTFLIGCGQEEIAPQFQLEDPQLTEKEGGEKNAGVKGKTK